MRLGVIGGNLWGYLFYFIFLSTPIGIYQCTQKS
jgi:uncharacterized membrane protein